MSEKLRFELDTGIGITVAACSIEYASNTELIYPIAKSLAVYEVITGTTRFLAKNKNIKCFKVAPNLTVTAVAELSSTKCEVCIYHIASRKLLQTLKIKENDGVPTSLGFSGDSKFVSCVTSSKILYWK